MPATPSKRPLREKAQELIHPYEKLPTDDKFDGEDEQSRGMSGEELLESNQFQCLMALLILANALVIGLETDIPDWKYWHLIEMLFLLAFASELSLKLYILGIRSFFSWENTDFYWNAFDMFIVGLGVFDCVMSLLKGKHNGGFATLFRIIRLARILRLFRIIKFLKQLYLLAFGLVEAMKAVFWVAILMCFVLYVCSIVLVKTVGNLPYDDPNSDFLNYHFGAIPTSMLSLFSLMSAPDLTVYKDQEGLFGERPSLGLFLICFITFGSFGIIAMLTGVISESMFEKNEMRKQENRKEHEAMRSKLSEHTLKLFDDVKVDRDGLATVDAVMELAPQLRHMLEAAGGYVTNADVERMIANIDIDGDCMISQVEFVQTMDVFAHGLSPIGIQEVHHEVGLVAHDIGDFRKQMDSLIDDVTKLVKMLTVRPGSSNEPLEVSRPPGRAGVDVDNYNVAEMMSQHTQIIHTEMARQCKEFAVFQERSFVNLYDILLAAQPPHPQNGVGLDVPDCIDLPGFATNSVKAAGCHGDCPEKRGPANTTSCEVECAAPDSFVSAAGIAAKRLGFVVGNLPARRSDDGHPVDKTSSAAPS